MHAAALAHIEAPPRCSAVLWIYTSDRILMEQRIDTQDNDLEEYPLWVSREETLSASVD